MVVFGASNSDAGRAFNAPSAFQFEQYGIGPAPFKRLYEALDSNVSIFLSPLFSSIYRSVAMWTCSAVSLSTNCYHFEGILRALFPCVYWVLLAYVCTGTRYTHIHTYVDYGQYYTLRSTIIYYISLDLCI